MSNPIWYRTERKEAFETYSNYDACYYSVIWEILVYGENLFFSLNIVHCEKRALGLETWDKVLYTKKHFIVS